MESLVHQFLQLHAQLCATSMKMLVSEITFLSLPLHQFCILMNGRYLLMPQISSNPITLGMGDKIIPAGCEATGPSCTAEGLLF